MTERPSTERHPAHLLAGAVAVCVAALCIHLVVLGTHDAADHHRSGEQMVAMLGCVAVLAAPVAVALARRPWRRHTIALSGPCLARAGDRVSSPLLRSPPRLCTVLMVDRR